MSAGPAAEGSVPLACVSCGTSGLSPTRTSFPFRLYVAVRVYLVPKTTLNAAGLTPLSPPDAQGLGRVLLGPVPRALSQHAARSHREAGGRAAVLSHPAGGPWDRFPGCQRTPASRALVAVGAGEGSVYPPGNDSCSDDHSCCDANAPEVYSGCVG